MAYVFEDQQPTAAPKSRFVFEDAPAGIPVKHTPAVAPTRQDFSQLAGGSGASIQSMPGFWKSLLEESTAPFKATPETEAGVAPPVSERFGRAMQFFNAPFSAISRGTTKYAGENLPISPAQAETIGESAGALASMIPVGRAVKATRQALTPARTIDDLIAAQRPGLPAPAQPRLALPPPEAPAPIAAMDYTSGPVIAIPPERPKIVMGQSGYRGYSPEQVRKPVEQIRKPKLELPDEPPFDIPPQQAAPPVPREIPPDAAELRGQAQRMRELAEKERSPVKSLAEAEKLEAQAAALTPARTVDDLIQGKAGAKPITPETPVSEIIQPKAAEPMTFKQFTQEHGGTRAWLEKNYPKYLENFSSGRPFYSTKAQAAYAQARQALPQAPESIGQSALPKRGPLDIIQGEEGRLMLGKEAATGAPEPVSATRLAAGGLGEESSKTISKTMGEEGTTLAQKAKAVRNDAEIEAGRATNAVGERLNGLNPKQIDNFVDVLEGKAKPIDPQVEGAFTVARRELDKVAARAQQVDLQIKNPVTGEKYPFQPRQNYYPHTFDKELGEAIKDPFSKAKIKEQLKAQMERTGKAVTDKEVEGALQAMMKATRGRYGHLELARIFDLPGYSRDAKTVLAKHFSDAYHRINIAGKFGPDLAKGEELLTGIGGKYGNDAESFARTYFQRVTGTEPGGSTVAKKAVTFATNYQAASKLGQAVISNLSQPSYTAIVAGAKNAAKGYGKAFTKEGKAFAEKTGAILNDTMSDFLKDAGGKTDKSIMGKAADFVLEKTGFTYVERLNRTMAANTGRYFARDMFDKLKGAATEGRKASYRETLQKLNIDVDAALKRGSLSNLDELRAGQSIVNRTQFKTDVTEIPLFWSSDAGRLLTQFKKFQFKSGQLVKDEIIKEIGKGNVLPFIRAAAILPIAGLATVTAKDAVRWGPQSEKTRNLADYLAAVGTFGAFTDAFAGTGRQPVRGLSYLAGPTLGGAGQLWEAGTAITQERDFNPLAKFAVSQVPVVGPSLRQLFNKPRGGGREVSERTQLERELGLDAGASRAAERRKMVRELGLER